MAKKYSILMIVMIITMIGKVLSNDETDEERKKRADELAQVQCNELMVLWAARGGNCLKHVPDNLNQKSDSTITKLLEHYCISNLEKKAKGSK